LLKIVGKLALGGMALVMAVTACRPTAAEAVEVIRRAGRRPRSLG
jgi:hypothetical protein